MRREIGLDGLVITEHDYQWEAGRAGRAGGAGGPLRVFSGAEISAREGHFLVYGLPSLDEVPPGISAARSCSKSSAAMTPPSSPPIPFRWDQPFDAIVAEHGPAFDALELVSNNVTPETRSKTEALLRATPHGGDRLERRPRARRRRLLFHRVRFADRFDCRLRGGDPRPPRPSSPSSRGSAHQRSGRLNSRSTPCSLSTETVSRAE